MRALTVDSKAPSALRLTEISVPQPRANQALIEVHYLSVNFSELRYASTQPQGTVLGYDLAGIVLEAAVDGSGPAAGSRVVAFGPGAWAERVAVNTMDIAIVPDSVSLADVAAVPMVGIAALRALRVAGSLLGKRVLVTGAAGGFGRFAVQLAHLGGAYVLASTSSRDQVQALLELGADEAVLDLHEVVVPVDVVLETVGGQQLVTSWGLVKPGGTVQSVGWASGESALFPPNSTFALGTSKSLNSVGDARDVGSDLATLVDLIARGRLSIEVGWRGGWDDIASAAEKWLAHQIKGKIVLRVK